MLRDVVAIVLGGLVAFHVVQVQGGTGTTLASFSPQGLEHFAEFFGISFKIIGDQNSTGVLRPREVVDGLVPIAEPVNGLGSATDVLFRFSIFHHVVHRILFVQFTQPVHHVPPRRPHQRHLAPHAATTTTTEEEEEEEEGEPQQSSQQSQQSSITPLTIIRS